MNMNKRFLSLALAFVMVLGSLASLTPVLAAETVAEFTDVEEGKWYFEDIKTAVQAKLVEGYEDNTFKPNNQLSRAEMATILARAFELETEADLKDFTDVKSTDWFYSEMAKVVEAKIMQGDNNKLTPNANITREEGFATVARALGLEAEAELNKEFPDADKMSAWAKQDGEVYALLNIGFISGDQNGNLNPTATITRAEMTKIMNAALVYQNVDLEALNTAVKAAEELVEEEYTAETWAVLEAALILPESTQAEADAKVAAINAAIAALEALALEVVSVSAINATQVEVKFSKAVKEADVVDSGNSNQVDNVVFNSLDGNAVAKTDTVAELSEDGKTLTISAHSKKFEGRYQVTIDGIQEKDSTKTIKKFDEIVKFEKDTVAPKVLGYEQVDADNVKINFSKPMATGATFEFKDAQGQVIATGSNPGEIPSVSIATAGDTSVTVDLSNIAIGKKITATIKNAKDLAGNLVTPQPSTIVIERNEVAAFAPTISTVTQTGAKTFKIKFSEALDGKTLAKTHISLVGGSYTVDSIEKISNSEYKVETQENLDGLVTVTVDDAGVKGPKQQSITGDLEKIVTFVKDEVAPKATAKLVSDKNNKQVIQLTFDKDVKLTNSGVADTADVTVAGSQVKNGVTTTGISKTETAVYADGKGDNKKVVNVSLSDAALSIENAKYTVELTSSEIVSDADVAMTKVETEFTRGKDGDAPVETNKTKATVKTSGGVTIDNNDQITVVFDQDLDTASATNVNNYKINNAVVESATVNAGSLDTVILKIKKGSVTDSYDRTLTIENVKAENSTVTMDKYTKIISMVENVRPTVESAKFTNVTAGEVDEITLTFSEAVKATTTDTDIFQIYVGTSTTPINVANADISGAASKTVVLDLTGVELTSAQIAQGVKVKLNASPTTPGTKIVDVNTNALDITSVNAAY